MNDGASIDRSISKLLPFGLGSLKASRNFKIWLRRGYFVQGKEVEVDFLRVMPSGRVICCEIGFPILTHDC